VTFRPKCRNAALDRIAVQVTDEDSMDIAEPSSDRHRQPARAHNYSQRLSGSGIVSSLYHSRALLK
jgi:hypothetical protein